MSVTSGVKTAPYWKHARPNVPTPTIRRREALLSRLRERTSTGEERLSAGDLAADMRALIRDEARPECSALDFGSYYYDLCNADLRKLADAGLVRGVGHPALWEAT